MEKFGSWHNLMEASKKEIPWSAENGKATKFFLLVLSSQKKKSSKFLHFFGTYTF